MDDTHITIRSLAHGLTIGRATDVPRTHTDTLETRYTHRRFPSPRSHLSMFVLFPGNRMGDRNEKQGSAATAATERARALLRARAQAAAATTMALPVEAPAGTTNSTRANSPRAVTGAPALPMRIQAWANLHAAPRWHRPFW